LNTPDIPATLLGLLGLESRIPDQWQGADHSRFLTDSSGRYPEYQLYWNNYDQSRGIRTLRHTCVLPKGSKEKEAWVLQEPVLFDNLNDPWQIENLATEKKQMVRDFAAITDELCRGLGDTWSS
jgi:arylsulfatase A-like enzyme